MEGKDKARPNFIIILSLIGAWLLLRIVNYLFFSPQKLQYTEYSVDLILSIVMIIPTILLMIFFIKKSESAKIMIHITSIVYILSSIISYIQATVFPSGNQVVTGPMKISIIPIQFFYIAVTIFFWVILFNYLKRQGSS